MLNMTALQGRLVADPELRKTQSGVSGCRFRIAVDAGFGDKKKTSFFDCVAWRQTAEFLCRYFRKGQLLAVGGSLQAPQWEDRQGNRRQGVEILAEQVHFCGGKPETAAAAARQPGGGEDLSDEDLPF